MPVVNLPTLKDDPVVDSYNPFAGPYGGSNVGPAPSFVPGSSMPSLSEPVGLGPYQGTLTFSGVGTTTVDTDIHCKEFIVNKQHIVRIKGHVTILVDELFKVENGAAILEFDHGASLALFIKKDFMVQDHAVFSLGDDPARLTISNLGLSDVVVQNHSYIQKVIPHAVVDQRIVQGVVVHHGHFIVIACGHGDPTRIREHLVLSKGEECSIQCHIGDCAQECLLGRLVFKRDEE